MAEQQRPRGRGAALLDALKRREQKEVGAQPQTTQPSPDESVPKASGRGALLQKLRAKKLASGDSAVVGSVQESPATTARDVPTQPIEQITKAIEDVKIAETRVYRGESGKPLNICSNYVRLKVEKNRGVFEYEVRFNPPLDAKSSRIRMLNMHMREMGSVKVYDGGSWLYLPSMITDTSKSFVGSLPSMEEDIEMTLIYKRKRPMGECLHLYNVLFKRIMHILLYTQMGRNYFSPNHKTSIPQHKLEVFPGFAVTVDELEDGLMLCLDTQHRVLRTQNALALLNELRISDPRNFKELAQTNIIGSCVFTRYNNKTYIVDDILWDLSPQDTFPTRDGSAISFIDYYKKQYDITIEDVHQPMLLNRKNIKKSQSTTKGPEREEQLICLVPELCYLTGLTDAMRNDFRVMKDVAQFTRVTPHQRMLALRTYLDNVRKSEKAQELLKSWGLELADGAIDLHARVLDQEVLWAGGDRSFRVGNNADWNRALSENKLAAPIDLHSWIVFYTNRDSRHANDFAHFMTKLGPSMGCMIKMPQLVMLNDDRTESYNSGCRQYLTRDVQAVVFICPTMRSDRYSIIKKICCTEIPVASQVIMSRTLSNPSKARQIMQKIALQINCKLGGSLWAARFPFKGWMICGIDVYHGAGNKSVCGFIASMNESISRWFSVAVFQQQELGDFLRSAFVKALEHYKNTNGCFPQKVIIYRDGVSDSQLDYSLRYEVTQFEDVLKSFQLNTTICFIVVQKRISTRIYAVGSETVNPPHGTILDYGVTKRNFCDFFLVAQNVRQGTVNPTRYIVLYDTCKIKPDNIQRLSYKLCHLYYNWAGTIRVPAPCQYAHKLAALVGQHIQKAPSAQLCDKLFYL